MAEEDTWELRENLGNAEDLVEEFEKEYSEIGRLRKRRNNKENRKGELPSRYTAKMLYGWDDKKFDEEYWGRLERNWKKQKGKEKERLERIDKEVEEEEIEEGRIEEWDEEDEMGKMGDIYEKLQEIFGMKILKREVL